MIGKNVKLAIIALKINKMRSILTMLGIIIGIAAVIAIVSIGNSMTESVNANFSSFGANNITAYVREKSAEDLRSSMGGNSMMGITGITGATSMGGGMSGGGMSGGGGGGSRGGGGGNLTSTLSDDDKISIEMINELKDNFQEEIEGVSVTYSYGTGTARNGDYYANVSINGVIEDYVVANSTTLLEGRFINDLDLLSNRKVAVVSDKFVENMFGINATDAIGTQVKVYMTRDIEMFTIIGVYEYDDSSVMSFSTETDADLRTDMLIPITTAQEGLIYKNHSQATIVVSSNIEVLDFIPTIEEYFADIYRFNQTYGITISSMEEQLSTITDSLGMISMTVACIASISLLVGGIGIMNIMLVSVTERTREIGIRKALGAKQAHIKMQFITEAGIISAIGGLIGTIIGTIGGIIGANIMGSPPVISVSVIFISVFFSMAVGMFFGYYPANKAAVLNPIDALRYE